jgi:hypothetical protein
MKILKRYLGSTRFVTVLLFAFILVIHGVAVSLGWLSSDTLVYTAPYIIGLGAVFIGGRSLRGSTLDIVSPEKPGEENQEEGG